MSSESSAAAHGVCRYDCNTNSACCNQGQVTVAGQQVMPIHHVSLTSKHDSICTNPRRDALFAFTDTAQGTLEVDVTQRNLIQPGCSKSAVHRQDVRCCKEDTNVSCESASEQAILLTWVACWPAAASRTCLCLDLLSACAAECSMQQPRLHQCEGQTSCACTVHSIDMMKDGSTSLCMPITHSHMSCCLPPQHLMSDQIYVVKVENCVLYPIVLQHITTAALQLLHLYWLYMS